jgi:hypothetical protein
MLEALARSAADVVELALVTKPELVIHGGSLPSTAEALRDLLALSNRFFDRGYPVRLARRAHSDLPAAVPLTKNMVVIEAHRLCQPVKINGSGESVAATLPDRVAQMYLDMVGEWELRPLAGISTSPLLSGDGSLRSAEGYDPQTGLWCCQVPRLTVSPCPSRPEAEAALRLLRATFRTFPFADAPLCRDELLGVDVVDSSKAPMRDESAFLVALLTACCRCSLWLAPGLLVTAPTLSGAGSGKGLLIRAISTVAFGVPPEAVTIGNDRQELDKRIAAELIEAQPTLFLDNANGLALRSDCLASALTERPARVRLLGQTRMVRLNSTAFVAITGNGLTVSEDLARRFLCCELDARCEEPESRSFAPGFLGRIAVARAELLTAALTIWRWGRQNSVMLSRGKPLGSYELWAEWCRDPLLALGCQDPVQRIETLKARDSQRQHIAELFGTWWEHHQDSVVKANDLAPPVKAIADPQAKGRQFLAGYVGKLAGTHAAGWVLVRCEGRGKWSVATYQLRQATPVDVKEHRGHRGHRGTESVLAGAIEPLSDPMTPMTPMPGAIGKDDQRVCAHCHTGGGAFCEASVAGETLWLHLACKDAYRPA